MRVIPGSEFDLEIDQLIAAIGQRPDLSAIEDVTGLSFSTLVSLVLVPVLYQAANSENGLRALVPRQWPGKQKNRPE